MTNQAVGVELEYEGSEADRSSSRLEDAEISEWWSVHTDGSLRPRDYNTEFVFSRPLIKSSAVVAVSGLCDMLRNYDDDYYQVSWRCGLHVHVDHRKSTPSQVYREVLLACFLDRVWYAWDNTGRQESKFCVPTSQIWEHMCPQSDDPPEVRYLHRYKYTGLNISRAFFPDIGTAEYRYAGSSRSAHRIIDYVAMAQWCSALAGEVFTTGTDLIASFRDARTYEEWFSRYAVPDMAALWAPGLWRLGAGAAPTTGEYVAAFGINKYLGGTQGSNQEEQDPLEIP